MTNFCFLHTHIHTSVTSDFYLTFSTLSLLQHNGEISIVYCYATDLESLLSDSSTVWAFTEGTDLQRTGLHIPSLL